ncbi:hypothetical protein SERLA73DRAFT_186919 [Serpula lacrymans var. lacrymans S7.3]|uniref:Uncharacterized protein n=2 Tax=Serpula lacrymans var. lacrymans TaxID=341189 RepID=F8Q845_SERL3|nr:uncharacterized protein SERLADRAFT_476211 [Serpula lacrymans var. lacrymans S7.9]EGN95733.1 hypothetical protein SERLA73DRAFT_186919 [Serpula lacrymans var. lacrymans S7.3]EGO21261.1 hypothetical protein SERLADRAFT_476211 [Serpula lacrymans var. lacrymans S7.9]
MHIARLQQLRAGANTATVRGLLGRTRVEFVVAPSRVQAVLESSSGQVAQKRGQSVLNPVRGGVPSG